jgi:hypothetical protein
MSTRARKRSDPLDHRWARRRPLLRYAVRSLAIEAVDVRLACRLARTFSSTAIDPLAQFGLAGAKSWRSIGREQKRTNDASARPPIELDTEQYIGIISLGNRGLPLS